MNHLHHHQQAAAYANSGHHQLQDSQNGVQQQANLFNQYHSYSTPVAVYHNETGNALSSHQHQASAYHANYMANHHYNSQQQQQHQVPHYHQTTFGGQQSASANVDQHYQEQYQSRCYASQELARDNAERETNSQYGNSKFVVHSDDSENETTLTVAHQPIQSVSIRELQTSGGGGGGNNNNNNNKPATLDSLSHFEETTIGVSANSASAPVECVTNRRQSDKKRLKKTPSNNGGGGKKKRADGNKRKRRQRSSAAEDQDDDFKGNTICRNGNNFNEHNDDNCSNGPPKQVWTGPESAYLQLEANHQTTSWPRNKIDNSTHFTNLDEPQLGSGTISGQQISTVPTASTGNSTTNCNNNNSYQSSEQQQYARQAAYYEHVEHRNNYQTQQSREQSSLADEYSTPQLGGCELNERHHQKTLQPNSSLTAISNSSSCSSPVIAVAGSSSTSTGTEYNQLRILEMRKEKSRDAARSRRSKENHEFYELAKLLPLPAAITSQLDFLDKASIIRLTISFLKLRQFSVNGHPPWAPDFTTLGSVNPYSAAQAAQAAAAAAATSSATTDHQPSGYLVNLSPDDGTNEHNGQQNQLTPSSVAFQAPQAPPLATATTTRQNDSYLHPHRPMAAPNDPNQMIEKNNFKVNTAASLFDIHQGTHILQSLDGFAFAIGRDGRFLYISETVSMYLGLSQVEMTGSSVFDYTHQQDHEELAQQLGISYSTTALDDDVNQNQTALGFRNQDDETSQAPNSVQSQYSAASSETLIEDHLSGPRNGAASPMKRLKIKKCSLTKSKQQKVSLAPNSAGQLIKLESSEEIVEPTSKQSSNGNKNNLKITLNNNSNNNDLQSSTWRKDKNNEDLLVRQFCIRMKSTLTKRGCQHFKSSGYRVVHVVAHLRSYQSNDHGHLMDPLDDPKQQQQQQRLSADANRTNTSTGNSTPAAAASTTGAKQTTTSKQIKRRGPRGGQSKSAEVASEDSTQPETNGEIDDDDEAAGGAKANSIRASQVDRDSQGVRVLRRSRKIIGMVAVAIALPPPSINELRLESDTFVLRLNLDLKITHVEPKITELLHHPMELLTGQSLYSFVHPADLDQVANCHRDLLKKGQMMSGYYRLLSRTGGYIWIQTCATLICHSTLNASLMNSSTGSNAIGSPVMSMPNSQQQAQLMGSLSDNTNYRQQQAPTPSGSSSFLSSPINHQQVAGNTKLVASSSPSVSGSFTSEPAPNQHLDLQLQQQQAQDQCIIFVNYMITNVVEQREILDICQSKDFLPLMITNPQETHRNEANSNNNNNNNNDTFNSSSSTRSSPCSTSFKSVASFLPSVTAQTSGLQTASNIINLSANSPRSTSTSTRHQTQTTTGRACSSQTNATKAARRQSAKVARQQQQSQHQTYLGLASGSLENGYGAAASPLASCSLNYTNPYEGVFQQQQHQASYLTHSTDGVNLAVLKHHNHNQDHQHSHQQQQQANQDSSAWLTSHASQQHHHQADHTSSHYGHTGNGTTSATYPNHHDPNNQQQSHQQQHQSAASNDHYQWNLNGTSIYKAATFAAANLAASSYSSVAAQQAAVAAAAYHQQHPAAVGGYSHNAHTANHHQHHPAAATVAAVAAAAHHHHHNHHHHAVAHHAIGLGHTSWESVASGAIAAQDASATPASSSLMAAVTNPYAHHHHQHHPHPPWL